MDALKTLANYWFCRVGGTPTPIGAAMANAVLTIEHILTPERFDEETITSAFLGALAGGLPWIAEAVGTQQDELAPISWGHYAKSRSKQTGAQAEADYGADFALAVRIGDDLVRVALFQAKRPKLGQGGTIHVFKDSGDKETRTRQFSTPKKLLLHCSMLSASP